MKRTTCPICNVIISQRDLKEARSGLSKNCRRGHPIRLCPICGKLLNSGSGSLGGYNSERCSEGHYWKAVGTTGSKSYDGIIFDSIYLYVNPLDGDVNRRVLQIGEWESQQRWLKKDFSWKDWSCQEQNQQKNRIRRLAQDSVEDEYEVNEQFFKKLADLGLRKISWKMSEDTYGGSEYLSFINAKLESKVLKYWQDNKPRDFSSKEFKMHMRYITLSIHSGPRLTYRRENENRTRLYDFFQKHNLGKVDVETYLSTFSGALLDDAKRRRIEKIRKVWGNE